MAPRGSTPQPGLLKCNVGDNLQQKEGTTNGGYRLINAFYDYYITFSRERRLFVGTILVLTVVALLLWGGHWMPWHVAPALVGDDGLLRRPLAYGYGCACILTGFVLYAALHGPMVGSWDAVLFLGADMAVAGLGTIAPRVVRSLLEVRALRRDRAYEQANQERE